AVPFFPTRRSSDLGGFAEEREVRLEQLRALGRDPGEGVVRRGDLLVVVEDPGEVHRGRGGLDGELEEHRDAALHVAGAAARQLLATVPDPTGREELVGRGTCDMKGGGAVRRSEEHTS